MTSHKQKKDMDTEEKVKLSQEIENSVKKADMCQEFGLVNSTMNIIWMNRTNY